MIISRSFLLGMRNVSGKGVEKIKTHIYCSVTFTPKILLLMTECGKKLQIRTGHRCQYDACAFHLACL